MEIEKWLNSEYEIIRNREMKSISDKLADLANRGVMNSSFALPDCLNAGLATLRNETIRVIEELKKFIYLSNKDFQLIKGIIQRKINEDFEFMYQNCNRDNEYNNRREHFQFIIDNIQYYTNSHIDIQIHLNNKKRLQVIWDICKMVLSAIIGGVIGYTIKTMLP